MKRKRQVPFTIKKGQVKMIPELNPKEWYRELVRVNIDRRSLLELIGLFSLVSRNSSFDDSIQERVVKIGRAFIQTLFVDGLILPDEIRELWEASFDIQIKPDRTILFPELTDSEGRPWK